VNRIPTGLLPLVNYFDAIFNENTFILLSKFEIKTSSDKKITTNKKKTCVNTLMIENGYRYYFDPQ